MGRPGLATTTPPPVHMNQVALIEPGTIVVGGFFGLLVVLLVVSIVMASRG